MISNSIKNRISNLKGNLGIYYIDLNSEESFFVGNEDLYVAAGIAMIPLLIEVFSQIEQKRINKTDIYKLTQLDKAPSVGLLRCLHENIELTIEDLYRIMIAGCDNTAYNVLVDIVGIENVNATLDKLGFHKTRVNRKFFDYEQMKKGIENYFSLQEIAEVFYRLYHGQIISRSVSKEILEVLKAQQHTSIIPNYLGRTMEIAHLVGEDEGTIHDVGLVLSKQPFVICMASNNTDIILAKEAMRDIVFMCHKNSQKYS